MCRTVRFLHICHAYKSEISPPDKFFSTYLICDICDKYEVCLFSCFTLPVKECYVPTPVQPIFQLWQIILKLLATLLSLCLSISSRVAIVTLFTFPSNRLAGKAYKTVVEVQCWGVNVQKQSKF